MAAAARFAFRSSSTRSAAAKIASKIQPASSSFCFPKPITAPRILRSPVEMSFCVESLMPMHSVTSAALMTSLLSVTCRSYGWLTEVVIDGAQVPTVFVFGDSLVDPRNNNNLTTLAKANYLPNGIDFLEGVAGRYCNGGTVVDHLVNLLGLPLIPPFNNPNTTGANSLQGVNYRSDAAGILNETGNLYGKLWPMNSKI